MMSNDETLEAVKRQLEDHESRIRKLESLALPMAIPPVLKKLSIKEFLLSKKPQTDVDKALAIGGYLEKNDGFSSFNVKDIESGFRAAKEPLPKNINDCINKNVSKGYMMDATGKKDNRRAWVLTSSGEQCVEQGFAKKQ